MEQRMDSGGHVWNNDVARNRIYEAMEEEGITSPSFGELRKLARKTIGEDMHYWRKERARFPTYQKEYRVTERGLEIADGGSYDGKLFHEVFIDRARELGPKLGFTPDEKELARLEQFERAVLSGHKHFVTATSFNSEFRYLERWKVTDDGKVTVQGRDIGKIAGSDFSEGAMGKVIQEVVTGTKKDALDGEGILFIVDQDTFNAFFDNTIEKVKNSERKPSLKESKQVMLPKLDTQLRDFRQQLAAMSLQRQVNFTPTITEPQKSKYTAEAPGKKKNILTKQPHIFVNQLKKLQHLVLSSKVRVVKIVEKMTTTIKRKPQVEATGASLRFKDMQVKTSLVHRIRSRIERSVRPVSFIHFRKEIRTSFLRKIKPQTPESKVLDTSEEKMRRFTLKISSSLEQPAKVFQKMMRKKDLLILRFKNKIQEPKSIIERLVRQYGEVGRHVKKLFSSEKPILIVKMREKFQILSYRLVKLMKREVFGVKYFADAIIKKTRKIFSFPVAERFVKAVLHIFFTPSSKNFEASLGSQETVLSQKRADSSEREQELTNLTWYLFFMYLINHQLFKLELDPAQQNGKNPKPTPTKPSSIIYHWLFPESARTVLVSTAAVIS